MDLPTRADLFDLGATEILLRNIARPVGRRMTRESIFTDGTDVNILLAAASAMADEIVRQLAYHCAAFYLDSAESDDLDRLVQDRFSPTIVRRPAIPAVVQLQFTRNSGALLAVTLAVGTKVRTENGTEFELTTPATLALGSTGPATASAQAVNAGQQTNVAAGTLTRFVVAPPDAALQVNNAEPAAGGADRESDSSLRERARDFFRQARRGTLTAIEFGGLTVNGVAKDRGIEVLDAAGQPIGVVQLYISDAAGQANQLLVDAVKNALLEYRAAGIVVDVFTTEPLFVPIEYRLRFAAGTDTVSAFEELRFLTAAEVNNLGPGETLPTSLLLATARRVPGLIVLQDTVVSPVGDLVPSPNQVIRTRADLITATAAP